MTRSDGVYHRAVNKFYVGDHCGILLVISHLLVGG